MTDATLQREQLEDLICEHITTAGPAAEGDDLAAKAKAYADSDDPIDLESFEAAAAAVLLADLDLEQSHEPMPDHVARDLRIAAKTFNATNGANPVLATIAPNTQANPQARSEAEAKLSVRSPIDDQRQVAQEGRVPVLAWAGWLAAAAALVIAFVVATPEQSVSLPDRLVALRTAAADVIAADWLGMDDAALGAQHQNELDIDGEIVWSDDRNEGYMVLAGLTENDPEEFQYQLWIFDAERRTGDLPQFALPDLDILTQRPVDGGVFDFAPDENGNVIIPVDPKIRVGKAAIFAVTKEAPGGVVVSDRDIVFLAIPTQG